MVSATRENGKFETDSWTLLLTTYSDYRQANNMLCHRSSPNAFAFHILNAVLLGVWPMKKNPIPGIKIKRLESKLNSPSLYTSLNEIIENVAKGKARSVTPGKGLAGREAERKGCTQAASLMRAGAIQENNTSCWFCSHLLAETHKMTLMGPAQFLTSLTRSPSDQKRLRWSQPGLLLQHSRLTPLHWNRLCSPSNPFPNITGHALQVFIRKQPPAMSATAFIRSSLFPILSGLL